MEAKGNQYFPRMRIEKTNTVHDDIRVIVVGLLFFVFFIATPLYIIGKIEPSTHIQTTTQPKE